MTNYQKSEQIILGRSGVNFAGPLVCLESHNPAGCFSIRLSSQHLRREGIYHGFRIGTNSELI